MLMSTTAVALSRPSVLMFVVDDMRDEPGGFGGDAATPNLDKLAKRSAVFKRNYVQQAVCGPTRYCQPHS